MAGCTGLSDCRLTVHGRRQAGRGAPVGKGSPEGPGHGDGAKEAILRIKKGETIIYISRGVD
jgi:hypothetical protein